MHEVLKAVDPAASSKMMSHANILGSEKKGMAGALGLLSMLQLEQERVDDDFKKKLARSFGHSRRPRPDLPPGVFYLRENDTWCVRSYHGRDLATAKTEKGILDIYFAEELWRKGLPDELVATLEQLLGARGRGGAGGVNSGRGGSGGSGLAGVGNEAGSEVGGGGTSAAAPGAPKDAGGGKRASGPEERPRKRPAW